MQLNSNIGFKQVVKIGKKLFKGFVIYFDKIDEEKNTPFH